MSENVVGIYGDATAIASNPGYLDRFVSEIGLNRIIFGGGFNLSPKTRMLSLSMNGATPGITLINDDHPIRKAIDESHKRDIQVWGCISLYWAGAEHAPDLMAYDLLGKRMDEYPRRLYAHEQGSMTFCPNNEKVNAWFEAMLVEIAKNYDFQGYALTHARYCHPAFFEQMLGCGCPVCQRKAEEWGYDFQYMKSAMTGVVSALKGLTSKQITKAAQSNLGFFDFIQLLGQNGTGVIDWFNFRADAISQNLRRFSKAIHAVTPNFLFGSDTHYPSMALLVGHRYADLATVCDQILPLLSHNEIHFMDNLGSFATLLRQWVDGLGEEEAVSLVYSLFGIRLPDMPETIKSMNLGDPPNSEPKLAALENLVAQEMVKARLMSGPSIPSYPVIKGSLWPEKTVRRLMDVSLEAGHNGIVFQGTDSLFK